MMKKNYLKPEAFELAVVCENMVSTSGGSTSGDQVVDPDGPAGKPRSNEDRGEWGNVWK